MALRSLCLLFAAALALAGCSGGAASTAPSAPASAAGAPTAGSSCPPATGEPGFPALPAGFPADFPAPPGAADAVADDSDPAVVRVTFASPLPLREATAFVVEGLPEAGFQIVGGDREPHEADIVFAKGDRQGQLRIARVDECQTFWLVQVQR